MMDVKTTFVHEKKNVCNKEIEIFGETIFIELLKTTHIASIS